MCYETNVTDSQWEIVAEILEDGRKRQHSLQVIVDAILYVTKQVSNGGICRVIFQNGNRFIIIFASGRNFERKLKNRKKARTLCPNCGQERK